MGKDKFLFDCFICGQKTQFGPGRYDGIGQIKGYRVTVCKDCYNNHKNGWPAAVEHRLIRHLEEEGITVPAKNAKGLLPREFYPEE